MSKSCRKITVIGAGNVGATIAYSIAMQNMVSELAIVDVFAEKAEGEALDIRHGLSFFGAMNVRSGGYEEVKNADIIIISAGLGRKDGETRLDLAKKNVSIIKEITRNVMQHYNGGVLLVVSNPVDVNTYIVTKESGLPKGMVVGTGTALDSARLRCILSEKTGVDIKNVHGIMAGEHGDSQFAVWSGVHIAGMPLDSFCREEGIKIDKNEIEMQVKQAGAEVIKRKKATYYAISAAVINLCQAILKNHKSICPTSVLIDGLYGVSDVCLSLPNILGAQGAQKTIKFNFTEDELAKFRNSAEQIKGILKEIN